MKKYIASVCIPAGGFTAYSQAEVYLAADIEPVLNKVREFITKQAERNHTGGCPDLVYTFGHCSCGKSEAQRLLKEMDER